MVELTDLLVLAMSGQILCCWELFLINFRLEVKKPSVERVWESGPLSVWSGDVSSGRPTCLCIYSDITVTSAPVSMQVDFACGE